ISHRRLPVRARVRNHGKTHRGATADCFLFATATSLRFRATAVVPMQGAGTRGNVFISAAEGILLHTPATRGAGAGRTGDFSFEAEPGRAAIAGGTRAENRLQPFLFEPDFFHANRSNDHAVFAPIA